MNHSNHAARMTFFCEKYKIPKNLQMKKNSEEESPCGSHRICTKLSRGVIGWGIERLLHYKI